MGTLIAFGKRTALYVCLLPLSFSLAFAQVSSTALCQVSSAPVVVMAEGLTERLGDIVLRCSGLHPTAVFRGNFGLFLPVSITNRVDANSLTRDAVFEVDLGGGFVPTGVAGQVAGNRISFNGISYTVPASGNVSLRISNVRADMNPLGLSSAVPPLITGQLSSSLTLDQSQVSLAYSQPGMLARLSDTGISCYGSPVPDTLDLPHLFAANTAFASTRVTEGFASAFEARSTGLDSGTRFLVTYTGMPATAHLFVPDAVAGSDALQPTAGGDLGLPQAVGRYVPGSGALLLVRIPDADATGAGGSAVAPPQGSAPVTFGSVSEVKLTNGVGYAVYEVVSADPSVRETAQFPTFVSLPRSTPPAVARETVTLAAVSTVTAASTDAPVPRFAAVIPQSDCEILGGCAAPVAIPPKIMLEVQPIRMSALAGSDTTTGSPGTFRIHNIGGGSMAWTASVIYPQGGGWLTLNPSSGTNEAIVQVTAQAKTLTAGSYQATILVNAGAAGSQSTFVTLNVTAPPPPPAPNVVVSKVLSAATLQTAPLIPGSLTTLMGSHLSGKLVTVTFDGTPANLLYISDTQINLEVPSALSSRDSATVVVTADGVSSAPMTVPIATAWPAVFAHGVLNQDNGENTAAAPAKSGDILQIYATGIPKLATVSVQIGDRTGLVPVYAGDAPTCPGVQQVNVAVPAGVTGTQPVQVCATAGGQQYCSPAYSIAVQ